MEGRNITEIIKTKKNKIYIYSLFTGKLALHVRARLQQRLDGEDEEEGRGEGKRIEIT
jgi:hypothetical protein